jgi:hypothetical protein
MYSLALRKIKEINAEDAAELLEFNTYPGQRDVRIPHLNLLCEEIENGKFLTGDIAMVRMRNGFGECRFLVNGQHQLKAVIRTGIPIVVVYQEYNCETDEELSDLYRRFDNHAARTLADVVRPEAVALGLTWKKNVINLVVTAATFFDGMSKKSRSKVDKVKELANYIREGEFVDSIILDSKKQRFMMNAAICRAMIDTWHRDRAKAKVFWMDVRDGINLPENSPALVLRNYLFLRSGRRSGAQQEKREAYVKCIHGWNAFILGKKTSLAYFHESPIPKIRSSQEAGDC